MKASKFDERRERELIELWLLANEGWASQEQLADLSRQLEEDAEARGTILAIAHHQGWLTWQGGPTPAFVAPLPDGGAVEKLVPRHRPRFAGHVASWRERARSWQRSLVGVPLVSMRGLALVACCSAALVWLLPNGADVSGFLAGDRLDARIVGGTPCVWDSAGAQRLDPDHRLHEGDSLQLLEGIAELSLEHRSTVAKLLMEGPAAVVLAREAVPSLRYGKIIVASEAQSLARFPIETSFGRVMLDADTEVGVSAFGGSAQVHVFKGVATIESPWFVSPEHGVVSKTVATGEALFFDGVGDVALRVTPGAASRERFTPQVSMQADFLAVGHDYVQEIRQAAPLAYWRFERDGRRADDAGGIALNEMGDRFHGTLRGKIRWVGPEGNQAIEFGVTPEPGSLVVDEPWDDVLDGDFTLEAWIKPSHYHLGSIIGFIGEFDWQDRRNKHGVLLEVGGTSQPSTTHQPERIRFLHRPKLGVQGGVSCFSKRTYQPRRWQHVAAVRAGNDLKLYLAGELVATAEDAAPMALGLQLVLGQLYTETVERFFIGHVDEVAIYDRALAADEIRRHQQLLRPEDSRPAKDESGPAKLTDLSATLPVHPLIAHSLDLFSSSKR